jgi:two-component sensor histidine kinase
MLRVRHVLLLAAMLVVMAGGWIAATRPATGDAACADCAPAAIQGTGLLDTSGFPARWHCGTGWSPSLGWLHIASDLCIWASYMTIPALLAFYILRRRDVPFPMAGWLFVAFIFACGTGHLIEAGMFWWPMYRLSGLEKLATATVSVATAVAMVPILPKALTLPGLAKVNAQLETQVQERERAELELEQALVAKEQLLQRQRALIRELDHRVRNNLAGLLGLMGIYERSGKAAAEIAAAVRSKVRAMLHVHELMSPAPGAPIDLASLVERLTDELVPRDRRAAVEIGGPPVLLPAKQAGAMAMVVQELFTNSLKHGAVSPEREGTLDVSWDAADGAVEFRWMDRFDTGGARPLVEGVGLRLVRGFVAMELRGNASFSAEPDGFLCLLRVNPSAPDSEVALPGHPVTVAGTAVSPG